MLQYHDLLRRILDTGVDRPDRTGTGTRSVFGHQMRFDLSDGFPLITTKKLHLRSIVHELLWFIRGDTNVAYLHEHGVSIWDEWADPDTGDLGPIYGKQWRSWPTPDGRAIDQLADAVEQIQRNPYSRRLIVSAWNVGELDAMALPPCHLLFQFYVAPPAAPPNVAGPTSDGGPGNEPRPRLSLQLYQRSADVFLGVPFNIASYALLLAMTARATGCVAHEFVHTLGDAHLYHNHMEQARTQLAREPRELPTLTLNPAVEDLFAFAYDDVQLHGYNPHPHIKADVAV